MIEQASEESESNLSETERKPTACVSQKEYVPTPYRHSMWEGMEFVDLSPQFKQMDIEVVGECSDYDPMFERFDERLKKAHALDEQIEGELESAPIPEEVIEEIRKQAFEEGLEAGKALGLAEAQAEIVEKYETLASSMKGISDNIRDELLNKFQDLEQKSLSLSLEVARLVLSTTAEAKPEYILDVIRNGLKHLGASKPMKIRVSPQDFEFLEVVGLPEDLTVEGAQIQYMPDESIAAGCVVETDYGELNLELDRMWAEVKNNLFKAVS